MKLYPMYCVPSLEEEKAFADFIERIRNNG